VGVPDGVYEAWINPNDVSGWISATAGGFSVVGGNVYGIDFLYDPVDTGSVQGTVEGDFGPLEGVQVTVDDTLVDSTTSDGAYRFDLLDPGSHTVEFASSGYVTQTVDFDVAVGEVSTVDATLDRDTYPVSGVVTDSEGHGIEGAPVGIYSGPPSDATLVASTTSDEDGYYWVQLPNGVYGAWIFPGGAGTGVPSIANPFVVAGTEVSDVNFTFDPAASGSLVGTVSGEGSGPLEGAMVSITDGPALATEADGTYQFPSLTPGTYEVAFSAAGYNTTTETVLVDNGAETVQDATLSLAFGSISGVVTDETGPVAGVDVLVDGGGSTVTDVNGKYSLLDVDAGPQTLIFIKDGYAEQIIDTSVTSQENTVVDAVLVPITTGSISGVISDANGPLGGADVVLMPGGLTTTAEDGSYSFDALDPGDYKLAVTKDGYVDQVLDATVALGENTVVDAELAPVLGSIDGTVRDVHGPLSGVSVSIQDGPSTATDASGKYSLPSLPLGTYQVDYEKDGYLTVSDSLVVSDATAITNDVTMTVSVGSISGVVRDENGPIAGVDVVLMPGGLTTTASDGSYSFDALDAGPYKLAFSKDGYDAQTVDTTVTSGENTVANAKLDYALGSITGTVTDLNGPVAGVTVRVRQLAGVSALTDSTGTYQLSGLPVDDYTLDFTKSGYDTASAQVTRTSIMGSEPARANAVMQKSVGGIVGTVRDSNGPLSGVAVQVLGGPATTTDASGRYTLSGLTPAAYQLAFTQAGYVATTLSTTVSAGTNSTLDATLAAVQPPVVLKRISVSRPSCSSSVRHGRSFSVAGTLSARTSTRVSIKAYILRNHKWVLSKTVTARVSQVRSTTRYSASMSLPKAGSWRLVASFPGDQTYAGAASSARSVRVR
jgi:protocatechuate 3,4-dioxygenase beta subunit